MKQRLVYTLLLCAAILVVFQQVRGFAFLTWDDNINVTENASVAGATLGGLAQIWREPYANLYVPIAYTWYWALAALSHAVNPGPELDPRLFHVGNLALHALATLFVFRIAMRLVASERAAFVGALAFALHPLVAESVAWVTEARGLLSAVLAFAALDLSLYVAVGDARGTHVRRGWCLGLATVLFAAALLAKPQAAALPIVALVLDRFVVGRTWKRALPLALAWSVLALGAFVLTKAEQGDSAMRFVTPLWGRPIVALDALGFYLHKAIAPFDLTTDYGRTPAWVLASLPRAWPALLVVAVVVALATVRRARRFLPCFALSCAALAPVSGLVSFAFQDISTVADRYAYPALLGFALAVAFLVERSPAAVQWAAAVLIAAVLGTCAAQQADTWRSNETLFARVLEVNPRSWKAYSNLALAATRAGRLDEAVAKYRRALEVGPSRWIVHQNLGMVLYQQGLKVESEAQLARSFELRRENLMVAGTLGSVRLELGQYAAAEEPLRQAVMLDPNRPDVAECLGASLLAQGKDLESIAVLRRALELRDSPDTRKNLAQALMLTGDVRAAIAELRRVTTLRPGWGDAELDLAWLLATSDDDALRNGQEARALAEHAVAATKARSARTLDTLAAAQAAAGDFDSAEHTAQEAIRLMSPAEAVFAARIEERRKAYAEKRSWRSPVR